MLTGKVDDTSTETAGAGVEFEYRARAVFTKVPDWIIFHPEVTPAALQLYCALRSTVNERTAHPSPRSMSMEEMGQLLPATVITHGKRKGEVGPPSKDKIRDALQCLVAAEVLTVTRKATHHTPARYQVNDEPPAGYTGTVSGYDRMNLIEAARPDSGVGTFRPQDSGVGNNPPLRGSEVGNNPPQDQNFPTPESQNRRSNRGNSAPKNRFKNTLSQEQTGAPSPEHSGTAVTGSEREPKTTDKPSDEAAAFVAGLPRDGRFGPKQQTEVAHLVDAALAKGWTLPRLLKEIKWGRPEGPGAPAKHYGDALRDLPPAPTGRPKRAAMECPDHPGEPIDHDFRCEDNHAEALYAFRSAARRRTA